jgi:hypothetical protein
MNNPKPIRYSAPANAVSHIASLHPGGSEPLPAAAAGYFSGGAAAARIESREVAMDQDRMNAYRRPLARIAALVAGALLALAIGAPWLLYDAPPSPEAVFAASVCCAKAPSAAAPRPAATIAPAR